MAETDAPRSGPPTTALIAAGVLVLGLVSLFLLLRDHREVTVVGDDAVAVQQFEAEVQEQLGTLDIRPVQSLRVRARELEWRDAAGAPLIATPAVSFSVRVGAAMGGDLLLHDGIIERPTVNLVRTADGRWNYEQVVGSLMAGSDGTGSGASGAPRVALRDFLLQNGAVRVSLDEALYRATDVDVALASAELSGPEVVDPTFQVARASAILHLPDTTGTGMIERRVALQDARLRLADGALAFQVAEGSFGSSSFASAQGVWNPALGGLGLDMEILVTEGRLADVPWLPGEVPEGTSGRFQLRIEPLAEGRTAFTVTDASVTAPGSSLTGSLRAVLGHTGITLESIDARVDPLGVDLLETFTGPLPYGGTVRGTIQGTGGDIRFDLDARLAASPASEPFRTELVGRIAFTDAGVEVRSVSVGLDQVPLSVLQEIAPGLPLAGPISGTVSLEGMPGEAPLRLDVRLEAGGGIITVAGMVNTSGPRPSYDLQGRLIGVELRRVLAPAAPPAQVHAAFTLAGSGTEPSTAEARLTLNGDFTGWEAQAGDTLAIQAVVDRGLLQASQAELALGPIQLDAAGEWRFAGGTRGAIRYDLVVTSLQPLAPYLPRDGEGRMQYARGSLEAEGAVSGSLEAPALAGSIQAEDFRLGEFAAEVFRGEYDARLGPGLPRITAQFSASELRSPGGDFESAGVTIDFTEPRFEIALRGNQLQGGIIEIEAGGLIEEAGRRSIEVRRAEIDLADQRWRLPSMAAIQWTQGEAVRVDGLRLVQVEGPGILSVQGIVAPLDEAEFDVEVRELPVGDVLDLIGSPMELAGRLTLQGQVAGPTESPIVELEVALDSGMVRGVEVQRLRSRVGYRGSVLTLDASGLLGDSALIEASGEVPARLALGIPPSFELIEDGALSVRLETRDFPLPTLDPGIRSVTDIVGELDAEVVVAGTPTDPELEGQVLLHDAALTVPMLNQRYEEIQGTATLEGRVVELESVTARSDGLARVTGRMIFEELTNPTLDLRAELEEFRPQGVDGEDDAAAWGTLRLAGSLQAPRLTGSIRMDGGALSLAPIQEGLPLSDQLVGVAESWDVVDPQALDMADEGTGGLTISDLQVTAEEDLWFTTQEARAQLSGDLTINRTGSDMMIQGILEGEQGTFTLRIGPRLTRRFDIISANIRFFGSPEPNPALDITASRVVRTAESGEVDVRVQVSGTLNNPNLALASAGGGSVPESELFCFIALGRPCAEISSLAGGTTWGDAAALFGLTDILVDELGVPLNLDLFQVQIQPGADLGSAFYVTIGEELDLPVVDNVYALAEAPVSVGDIGDLWIVSLEWRIDRQWTLEARWEPTNSLLNTTSGRTLPDQLLKNERQFFWSIRRRWTY